MFLEKLEISTPIETIRSIKFHKGLNLIVDQTETETKKLTDSGNSIGKTTVLRLVDFCLGGKGRNIYLDHEFNTINTKIEKFLKDEKIIVTLTLKENLSDKFSKEIHIKRNFLSRKEKIQELNGKHLPDKEFRTELQKEIFKKETKKPSFRQIISKNIRYENNSLTNTVNVLHSSAQKETYEALYLFLFGIDTDGSHEKQRLRDQKKIEDTLHQRLKRDSSESQINQALAVLNRDIKNLEHLKETFTTNPSYEADIKSLNTHKASRNHLTTRIGSLSIRKELIIESKSELQKNTVGYDKKQLGNLYKEAKFFIPEIQHTFDDLVMFHNSMIQEKIDYVTKELPKLEKQLSELTKELSELNLQIDLITSKLKNSNVVEDLSEVVEKLSEKYEQKGHYLEQLKQWENNKHSIQEINTKLLKINADISSQEEKLEKRLELFNTYFSQLSEMLYGEQFIVSLRQDDRAYSLVIKPIAENPGTGKKKGQIVAFDFAYIQFCEANNIPCLHFVLYDQIETIHNNQLITISNIANQTNSQFICAVLKDKLPTSMTKYEILTLSEKDRLFKIP